MEWTKEARNERIKLLLEFKETVDSDDIKIKEKIKKELLKNELIIHVLNNKELEKQDAQPDDYYGVNILDYYIIEPTQSDVQNFICYEVDCDRVNEYNRAVKYLSIKFIILREQKNIRDKDTYIARHDLLAALLLRQFNHTNYFGSKIECTSDVASVVDSTYACRTLIFTQITDNNLVKSQNKIPIIANKDIVV
jgi:hypothetical protein